MAEKTVQSTSEPIVEVKPLAETGLINQSPFYKVGDQTLPDGTTVKQGGLYMMDDQSGTIYQVSTGESVANFAEMDNVAQPPQPPLEGLYHEDRRELVIWAGMNANAISYKNVQGNSGGVEADWISFGPQSGRVRISNLTPSGRDALDTSNQFPLMVQDRFHKQREFAVYNVHDQNGQLVVIHTIKPKGKGRKGEVTETEVGGLVYVQIQGKGIESEVLIGFLEKTPMMIGDPKHAFRE